MIVRDMIDQKFVKKKEIEFIKSNRSVRVKFHEKMDYQNPLE